MQQIAEDFNVPAYWYALSMEDAWQHRLTNFRRDAALANSFYDIHKQEQRAYVVVVAKGYRPPCGKSKSSEVMVTDAPAGLGGEQSYSQQRNRPQNASALQGSWWHRFARP